MDQSLFAAPHGFSQRTTSFIACACLGIHQTPFSHLIILIIDNRHPGAGSNARHKREMNGHPPDPNPLGRDRVHPTPRIKLHGAGHMPEPQSAPAWKDQFHENCPSLHPRGCKPEQLFSSRCHNNRQTVRRPPAILFFNDKPGSTRSIRTGNPSNAFALPCHQVQPVEPPVCAQRQRREHKQTGDDRLTNRRLVEPVGIEPTTSCLQSTRSPS